MDKLLLLCVTFACIMQLTSAQLRNTCRCPSGTRIFYEYATCRLMPDPSQRMARTITGMVRFRQKSCYWCKEAIEISVTASGLPSVISSTSPPAGPKKHGFHVHELGDLSGGCNTAAGHYNPFNATHGAPNDTSRHVGDLGNVLEDGTGRIREYFVDEIVSLTGNIGVLGRSIVLHAGVDDLGRGGDAGSKTTGNAGGRLACCVIGRATNTSWVKPSIPLGRTPPSTNVNRCSWFVRRWFPSWCGYVGFQ